ncbi:hypothetical protein N8664_02675 [Verrucomicrobia bacterium]|nr:hypothetical protein [Verrucomicrobiota bacterium]MDA7654070.1 hypothetical protein [Verrucomicrobiota bacterium]
MKRENSRPHGLVETAASGSPSDLVTEVIGATKRRLGRTSELFSNESGYLGSEVFAKFPRGAESPAKCQPKIGRSLRYAQMFAGLKPERVFSYNSENSGAYAVSFHG